MSFERTKISRDRKVTLANTPNQFLSTALDALDKENFMAFLASFESFYEEAPEAAKHHTFWVNLPKAIVFKMLEADNQLDELT